jgi:uncharacterized protein (DUF2062 family)
VITEVLEYVAPENVIIVNDGSTDTSSDILSKIHPSIHVLRNEVNKGKGYSLRKAFKFAIEKGFENAITIDSDGQHYPSDLPKMMVECLSNPNTVLMGSRNMQQEGVPQKSSFGNKFSNFWFKLETWISLPDTQTGYRVYPLQPLKKMKLFTTKFELEIELIVRLAWKEVKFKPVPIEVKYDPDERVSHFRPGHDLFRISVLNSVLVLGALLYYYPKKFLSVHTWRAIKQEAIKPEETNMSKALSLGFGAFMGIVPIWGFQLLIGIPLAIFFRMNKVLFIAAANISFPPLIPFIIYASLAVGQFLTKGEINHSEIVDFSLAGISKNAPTYLVGAFVLALSSGALLFTISFSVLSLFRKNPN